MRHEHNDDDVRQPCTHDALEDIGDEHVWHLAAVQLPVTSIFLEALVVISPTSTNTCKYIRGGGGGEGEGEGV